MVAGPGPRELFPNPRWSGITNRARFESAETWASNISPLSGKAWRSSTGTPLPSSRKWMRTSGVVRMGIDWQASHETGPATTPPAPALSQATPLPPKLDGVLVHIPDHAFAATLRSIFRAAAVLLDRLSDVDLVRYE